MMDRYVTCAVIALAGLVSVSRAGADEAAYFMPLQPGDALTFLISGIEDIDAQGNGSAFGPFVETLTLQSVNKTIFGQQANVVITGEGEPGFFRLDANGLYTISDGDPALGGEYEYYKDPRPFVVPDLIPLGQSIDFAGEWEGQWEDGQGGFSPWTGTWSVEITYVGLDTITTPLGTFSAHRFRNDRVTVNDYTNSSHLFMSTVKEDVWFADGLGLLATIVEDLDQTDSDGDGIFESSNRDRQTRYTLSFSGNMLTLPDAMLTTPTYNSQGGATQQAVADALQQVQSSTVNAPFGNHENNGGFGIASQLVTLEDSDVQQLVTALLNDGATPQQAFLRMEISYDEAILADFGITEADLAPYWWDEAADRWVLVGTTITGDRGEGMLATLPEHEGLVGYYGIDTAADVIWLNVNHASLYAVVTPIPEPTSLALLGIGIGLMLSGWRRRSRG